MPLDFASATRLFMGTEDELARALEIDVADLRSMRTTPAQATPQVLQRMGSVLLERGRGMVRVGEMLQEEAGGSKAD
jgi:hypothetical protein